MLKRVFLCVCFYLALLISPAFSQPNDTNQYKKVETLLDSWSGQREVLQQAKKDIDSLLQRNPNDYEALRLLSRYTTSTGYLYSNNVKANGNEIQIGKFREGTLQAAEQIIRKALSINPRFADGYVYLAFLKIQNFDIQQAHQALIQAEKIGTKTPWLHLNFADVYLAQGKNKEAKDRYMRVINETENRKALSHAYRYLVREYKENGSYREAQEIYAKILKNEPSNAWWHGEYANFACSYLGDYKTGLEHAGYAFQLVKHGLALRTLSSCMLGYAAMITQQKGGKAPEAETIYNQMKKSGVNFNHIMAYDGAMPANAMLVEYLISKGISVDAKSDANRTALMYASYNGRTNVVKHLLSLGANPNILVSDPTVKYKASALSMAVENGFYDIVKDLLEHRADPRTKPETPEMAVLARKKGYTDIVKLIEQYSEQY